MTGSGPRAEILTGPERRRRWSVDQKLAIVAEFDRPGSSGAVVARRYGISTSGPNSSCSVSKMLTVTNVASGAFPRVAMSGSSGDHVVPGNEHCRRRVAELADARGGHGSIVASCAWHVIGLEWSVRRWAAGRVRCTAAGGILIAALSIIEAHFAGRRPSLPTTP